jgi:hypothetical protein
MSEWLVLASAMAAACAVVLVIALLRQYRLNKAGAGADDDAPETPDVLEYMTMMVGVVYAIVLGLAHRRRLGGAQRRAGRRTPRGTGAA